jgi:hypothetical protein
MPSVWQERIKAWTRLSYPDFLEKALVADDGERMAASLWAHYDIGATARRWGRYVGSDHVTVLVADEDDRDLLPRAFERLLALPEGMVAPSSAQSNTSLTYPEAEVVRRLNRLARDEEWSDAEYRRVVQEGVVQALKRRDSSGEPRLTGVPEPYFSLLADRADQQVEALLSAGIQVVGDPEQLRLRDRVAAVPLPDPVTTIDLGLLADVAGGARAGTSRLMPRPGRADVQHLRDQLGGRQLLQLLARRAARRARLTGSRG